MEHKGEMTKALLGEKFKELVVKKSFDKITIKMITDEAGVIRPTFYNYFQDKYEVMEWLLWEDVFKNVMELIRMDMTRSAIQMLFRKIDVDKEYYIKVFEVEGQNSFEEMMIKDVCEVAREAVKRHPLELMEKTAIITEDTLLKFQSVTLVNGIKYWLLYYRDVSGDEALEFYEFLMSHSILDLLGEDEKGKVLF